MMAKKMNQIVDVVYTNFDILVAKILALGNNQGIENNPRFIFEVPKEAEMKTEG